jgi:type I restriction enzyme S subunit
VTEGFRALGDVAEFVNGAPFKPEDWGDTGSPIVRIQNLTDPTKPFNRTMREVSDRIRARRGDLLVSWSATLGVFTWDRDEIGLVNQHIFRVLPRVDLVDKNYLKHSLDTALASMGQHLHGATMQHVNRAEFLATEIPLPPLPEQRRIASILDQVDSLRALERARLSELKQLESSIFAETIQSREWPQKPLTAFVDPDDRINYGIVQPGDFVEGGVRVVRVSDLRNGVVNHQFLKRVSPTIESSYSRSRLRGNEVLVSCVGSIGEIATTTSADVGLNIARAVARVPIAIGVQKRFIAAHLRSAAAQAYFISELRTVTQPTLNIGQLALTPVPLVAIEVQNQFAMLSEASDELVAKCGHQLALLDELFVSLQHRAFRGEL